MRRNDGTLPARRDTDAMPSRYSDRDFFSPAAFFSGSPWQMMRRMQEDMDRLFGEFVGGGSQSAGQAQGGATSGMTQWAPHTDISQTDKEWCIEADLPGVNKDDVDVNVQDHHLILRAEMRHEEKPEEKREYHRRERRYGFFERVFPLPEGVDEEKISCDFKNGVLTVHVPKAEQQQAQGRRIPIGEGAASGGAATAGHKEGAQSQGKATGEAKTAEPAMKKAA